MNEPEEKEMTDEQVGLQLKSLGEILGRKYADHIIIVRCTRGRWAFGHTDSTWSVGACKRFLDYQKSADYGRD